MYFGGHDEDAAPLPGIIAPLVTVWAIYQIASGG